MVPFSLHLSFYASAGRKAREKYKKANALAYPHCWPLRHLDNHLPTRNVTDSCLETFPRNLGMSDQKTRLSLWYEYVRDSLHRIIVLY